jgi:hypothetical protein
MLQPLQTICSADPQVSQWNRRSRIISRRAWVTHSVMIAIIWIVLSLAPDAPGSQGWHSVEVLNLLWMSAMLGEVFFVMRLVLGVSRSLTSHCESFSDNDSDRRAQLTGLASRVKFLTFVYGFVEISLFALILVPIVFKITLGFFPFTTVCFALALDVVPLMNVVIYVMSPKRHAKARVKSSSALALTSSTLGAISRPPSSSELRAAAAYTVTNH